MKPKPKPRKPKPQKQSPQTEEKDTDFSFAVARIAVSQICQSVGFKTSQVSALETLTSVATKFMEALGKSSAEMAAKANRTETNLFDIAEALRAFRSGQAISAAKASDSQCSHDIAEIAHFAHSIAETPFAKPVPRPSRTPDVVCGSLVRRACHVPHWLPEFPEIGATRESVRVEELWENCVVKSESESEIVEEKKRERELTLGMERERVRFKLGLRKERRSIS